MAFEVSSVPLSLTIVAGLPRWRDDAVELARDPRRRRARCRPTSARHSRVQSSTTARMRKRRPSVSWSETKSSDQRWLGASGSRDRRPRSHRPLAAAAPAHRQPLLAVEPEQPLVVHHIEHRATTRNASFWRHHGDTKNEGPGR